MILPQRSCLLELTLSPLAPGELDKVRHALRREGVRPEWLKVPEHRRIFAMQLQTELLLHDADEAALAERLACAVWLAIGRYVRIVAAFPLAERWPGGIEFGEADYVRLLRR